MQPPDCRIVRDGTAIELTWQGRPARTVTAAVLWEQCPSAVARRARLDGRRWLAPAGIRIAALTAIGHYAVNIEFSDGHDRGVYPWEYLAGIADRPAIVDFIVPVA